MPEIDGVYRNYFTTVRVTVERVQTIGELSWIFYTRHDNNRQCRQPEYVFNQIYDKEL